MKLEKRSSGPVDPAPEGQGGQQPGSPASGSSAGGKKPVIVYIMILFIAAFLLMTLSFLMHQRSNSEVIGKLQDSVSTLQEMQSLQDQNLGLREQVDELEKEIEDLNDQLAQSESARGDAQDQTDAMLMLYTLELQYANEAYDECKQTIQSMEDAGQNKLLPKEAGKDGVTSPAERYQQLKEAVMSK